MKPSLLAQLLDHAEKLVRSAKRQRISNDEYQSIVQELDRLELTRAYYVVQSNATDAAHASCAENQELANIIIRSVKKIETRDWNRITALFKVMADKLKTGLGISDSEKTQIIKAMGMKQGHWFKCPNGHIYAIGECGGAMVEACCNECGEKIGGRNHRLLNTNALANEMDGATRQAWPGGLH